MPRPDEEADALEQLAARETDPRAKCARLVEAARVAHDKLGDLDRAMRLLQEGLNADSTNAQALAMAETIARSRREWTMLTAILEAKAKASSDATRDAVLEELVTIYKEELADERGAEAALKRVRSRS
jgi:hypothetical protein